MVPRSGPVNWRNVLSPASIIYTLLAVLSVVFALDAFMKPNGFIDGGLTGLAILLSHLLAEQSWASGFWHPDEHGALVIVLMVLLNIPFVFIGYHKIGTTFTAQYILALFFLVIVFLVLDMAHIHIPAFREDKILAAFFGGIFMGLGIGLSIRAGGVIDGLEVIAEHTTRSTGFSTHEVVLLTNSIVILFSVYIFDIENAMYSILTYFTAMRVCEYVVHGFEEFTALMILSDKHEKIKSIIVNDFKKGISVFKGERGFLPESFHVKADCDIIMTIVTRLQVAKIKEAILKEDPKAFLYVSRIKEVQGGVIRTFLKGS